MARLSQSIYNNPYGVMLSPTHQKANYEVHINGLQLPSRNLNNLSKTARLKMFCLNLLTIRTLSHVFCNVFLHSIPPIDLLKIMIHLGGTWMYGIHGTMDLIHSPGRKSSHLVQIACLVSKYAITSQSERLIHF